MDFSEKVFGFSEYKGFLKKRLGADGRRTGQRKAMADFLGIQTAFVSQVLKGQVHFSLEQSHRINGFLNHTSPEAHFFLLLVQRERAGTHELKEYFSEQIKIEREKHQQIQTRLKESKEVSPGQRSKYYSYWLNIGIHMALSVPRLQTPEAIASHFFISIFQAKEILMFLESAGLTVEKNGRYILGTHQIHLGHDAVDIRNHHTNMRLRGIDQLQKRKDEDLQYSVVYSCSREAAHKIKESFLKIIKENIETIIPSKEEVLFCNCIDFYEV